MQLSIIIPAYNEEQRIKQTLLDYYNYFLKNGRFEIIVVCDGVDRTANIVKNLMRGRKNIKILEFDRKIGKGGAIVEGFRFARYPVVGFTDADESVLPEDFYRLSKHVNGYDCIIGSRRIEGARILALQPLKRRIASRIFNIIVNVLFGLGIKDTQCGVKIAKRSAIKSVIDNVSSRGFEFDVEFLSLLRKKGFSINEMPITWRHGKRGSFSLWYGPKMLYSLLKLRFG